MGEKGLSKTPIETTEATTYCIYDVDNDDHREPSALCACCRHWPMMIKMMMAKCFMNEDETTLDVSGIYTRYYTLSATRNLVHTLLYVVGARFLVVKSTRYQV